jgi:hypothetical protein
MADYPAALPMFVDEQRTFIDALAGLAGDQLSIVIHKTGGPATINLANLASFFQTGAGAASTHFGIDLDGTVGQFVWLKDGAGGNCCVEQGYDQYWTPFLSKYGNLNRCTISIEHIDPSLTNSTTPPPAQLNASFALVKWLVQKFGIPLDHIKTHASIDPIDRANCPGNYPMTALFMYLQNGVYRMVPQGWKDDGTTLTAPNNVAVVLGFRDFVLSHVWDAGNIPLAPEQGVQLLEASNPALGGGTQQLFRWSMLGYSAQRGVFMEWVGQELFTVRGQLAAVYPAYQQLKTDNAQLTAKVATLEAQLQAQQTGLDAGRVNDRLSLISQAAINGNTAIQQLVTQPL